MQGTKFLVIGVGKYGREIARKLADKGAEVYAFDNDEQKIDLIKDEIALGVTLDATNIKVLQSQNVTDVDAVVVSIGENFEATILTCVQLMELGVERIIARASGPQQIKILKKIGVTEILAPEDEVADAVAERLLNPSLVRFLQLPDNYEIAEVKVPKAIADRTIDDIGLRNKYQLTLVTIKRMFEEIKKGEKVIEEHVLGVPNSDTIVKETDTLVVFGTIKDVQRFLDINS